MSRLSRLHLYIALVPASAVLMLAAACGGEDGAEYPIVLSDSLVRDGQIVYEANCATCHGDSSTRPPLPGAPPHTVDGHTWHHADRFLVEWILDGVPLAQVMPTFRGSLSEQEVRSAVAYIKTFWTDEVVAMQTENSAAYEKQLAGE